MKRKILATIASWLMATASSAAVVPIDLTLEYVGRTYTSVKVYDGSGALTRTIATLSEADDEWGLKNRIDNYSLSSGSRVRFQTQLVPVLPNVEPEPFLGYKTQSCQFGTYLDCSNWDVSGGPSLFSIASDYNSFFGGGSLIDVNPKIGATFKFAELSDGYGSSFMAFEGPSGMATVMVMDEYLDFRVVAVGPAPVPLPASAALLAGGVGVLSVMRRRKRRAAQGL